VANQGNRPGVGGRALDGRVVIVTGAGRGIGRAHARELAAHGARVVANDLSGADDVVQAIRGSGGDALAHRADVGTWDGAAAVVQAALDGFGRLDGLVNNAGVLRRADLADLDEDGLDLELRVNVKGAFACAHHACRYWRAESRSGRRPQAAVVHTASDTLFTGAPGGSGYAATKAAIVALAQSASLEGAHYGVRHNVVAPSGRTPMVAASGLLDVGTDVPLPEDQDMDAPDNPLHNSALVVWLLSPASAHVNGQVFRLRHGAFARMAPIRSEEWHVPPGGGSRWEQDELTEVMGASVFGTRFPAPMREYPDGTTVPFSRFDHG
jgi:NAD(P)-dependent dehydrogenase (short-subunit alcohol dehydrogenase family)